MDMIDEQQAITALHAQMSDRLQQGGFADEARRWMEAQLQLWDGQLARTPSVTRT